MIFRKRQTLETVNRALFARSWRRERDGKAEHRGGFRAVKLFRIIHVVIHLSKHLEGTTPRVNANVSCGFWVLMMCQHGFMESNKHTTLVCDVGNEGGCAYVGTEATRELSVPCAQPCCEHKTALKNKGHLLKNDIYFPCLCNI